jgi:hypothetical protein
VLEIGMAFKGLFIGIDRYAWAEIMGHECMGLGAVSRKRDDYNVIRGGSSL